MLNILPISEIYVFTRLTPETKTGLYLTTGLYGRTLVNRIFYLFSGLELCLLANIFRPRRILAGNFSLKSLLT